MPNDGPRSDAPRDVLTSTVLERLRADLPADFVTLGWFMSRLGEALFWDDASSVGRVLHAPGDFARRRIAYLGPSLSDDPGPASAEHSAASHTLPDQNYRPGFGAAAGDPSTSVS